MIDLKTDGHVHTRLCHHASGEMEDYVQVAISRGLERIIFLEHLERGINYFESTWLSDDDFAYYFDNGQILKEKYRGRIEIGIGVEVGYNPKRVEELQCFLARYEWDRIGLAYHFLEVGDRHVNLVSRRLENLKGFAGNAFSQTVQAYYIGLSDAIDRIPADVICHLDAVLRHHPEIKDVDQTAMIDEILPKMAEKYIALEVNTSGFGIRNEPFPSISVMRKAVALGIPLLAGSDAHRPDDVARYFDRLAGIIKN